MLEHIPNQSTTIALRPGDDASSSLNTYNYVIGLCLASAVLNPGEDTEWPTRVDGVNEDAPTRTATTAVLWIDLVDPTQPERDEAAALIASLVP